MESDMFWSTMSESCSSSSEDETGSSYSEESDENSLRMEEVLVCGKRLGLPQGLCEQVEVFNELISMDTWLGFSEQQRQHLKNFLPSFPEHDSEEKDITLRSLFARENIKFGNPLTEFHNQLKAGHYRPDINKMRRLLKRAQYKEYKHQQRRYYFQLMKSILVSRHRLLEAASRGGAGTIPRPDKLPPVVPRPSPVHQRVRRRYFQELAAVREEVGESSQSSDDENYPEGPPAGLNKKQKRQLANLEHSFSPDLTPVTSTLACKPSGLDLEQRVTPSHNPYDISDDAYREMLIRHRKRRLRGEVHPDLQTKGITTNEVMSRSQVIKKSSNSKPSAKKPKLKPVQQQPESLNLQVPDDLDGDITSESETIGGIEEEVETEKVDVEGDDEAPIHMPQSVHTPTSIHRRMSTNTTPNSCSSPRSSRPGAGKVIPRCRIKLEPPDEPLPPSLPPPLPPVQVQSPVLTKPAVIVQQNDINYRQSRMLTPATLSDLDGIDMMDLPVDLEEPDITFTQADIKPELTQETHACFFSLLRDIICSTPDHRMSLTVLEDSVKAWTENPISPLNDWYHLATADISGSLSSALNFLSGDYTDWQPEEFVPYLEYKSNIQAYQWIGAGRDTDAHLTALCRHWLERREDMAARIIKEEETVPNELDRDRLIALTPPPPRCPTTWTVSPSTPEEREVFREQERIRYENPHKAFTYRMHGYESVVGPVKGMYCQTIATNKPRGHSLLNLSRPNYVTILALVRDATARLPNGQGTRSDICTLLRDSQYLIPNSPDTDLNSVVSGALDRLHYECDPCVKYETKRKTWIYLHRGRTEEEAERMHQEQQRAVKPKNSRKAHRAAKALAQTQTPTPAAPTVQLKPEPLQYSKSSASAANRLSKAPTQRTQVTTTLTPLPEVNTVIKVEPGLETEEPLQVVKPQSQPQQRSVGVKQNVQKSLISTATLAAAAKKASLAAHKQMALDPEMKSIMGKTGRKVGQSTKAVKNIQHVKTETAKPPVTAIRRIPDKPVGSPIVTSQPTMISAVRHIPDAQIPASMPMHSLKQKSLTPTVLSAVRRLPDGQGNPMPTTTPRVKTMKAVKESTSVLEQNVPSPTIAAAKKKMTASAGVQATADPSPVLTKVSMAQAKSLVKMITTQAAVRTGQSPTQVTSQQMMLIKQAQQQFLNEQSPSGGKQQQLIVMKQSTDTQTPTSQPQMIVINQQQIVTDQQLTAKQHKQLQQLLVKQQYVEQQPQQTMAIQQQQLQQLILAKQQQMLAEQQKTGKPQQQMIVLKQQQPQQQQITSNQQSQQDQQKAQQLQQMILVKQQQQLLTGEPQQITQQQLQQMLLMKQQQQQQQQQQMILVKQQGDQKSSPTQVQTKTLVQQQSQTQGVQQQLSLAQLQQLQQQQQRVVTSSSLLSQSRVVAQVGVSGQTVSSASTSLIKPSQPQPMLAKMVTNAQGQPVISMESLLAHQKQHGSLPQGALRVATAAGKPGLPPQYTVVSVAQPRVIQATQLSQASSTTVAGAGGTTMSPQTTTGKIVTTMANQGNQIRMSGINLAHIGGKPVLLASKPQSLQAQNVILASQGTVSAGGQTVLLASQGLRGQTHTGAQGTLTVLQQGGQQILLPPGFHASTLNIKTLQGLKVIPLTPAQAATPNKGSPNRQQLFARILNPGGMRPVVANIVQTETAPPNPPSTTE